jgi:crotonobetainyl-CoA:carnitine CoA-transferase CaiB-like acyl-CoA transferase
MLALEGIKILDFTRNAPGMFCTRVLGDLGADILMVERPLSGARAEYARVAHVVTNPTRERRRATYNALQRNKRSIALNLKELGARQVVYRLAETADVLVEGFRPGVMDRLGGGYPVEAEDILGGNVPQVGIPIRLSDTPGRVRHPGPVTGQHTAQVLTNLGYTLEQVEEWRRLEGVQ